MSPRRFARRPRRKTAWWGTPFSVALNSGAYPNGTAADTVVLSQANLRTWIGQGTTVLRCVGSWYSVYTKSAVDHADQGDTLVGLSVCHAGEPTCNPRTMLEQENWLYTGMSEWGGDIGSWTWTGVPAVFVGYQVHTKERQFDFDIRARRRMEEPNELRWCVNAAHGPYQVAVTVRGFIRVLLGLS